MGCRPAGRARRRDTARGRARAAGRHGGLDGPALAAVRPRPGRPVRVRVRADLRRRRRVPGTCAPDRLAARAPAGARGAGGVRALHRSSRDDRRGHLRRLRLPGRQRHPFLAGGPRDRPRQPDDGHPGRLVRRDPVEEPRHRLSARAALPGGDPHVAPGYRRRVAVAGLHRVRGRHGRPPRCVPAALRRRRPLVERRRGVRGGQRLSAVLVRAPGRGEGAPDRALGAPRRGVRIRDRHRPRDGAPGRPLRPRGGGRLRRVQHRRAALVPRDGRPRRRGGARVGARAHGADADRRGRERRGVPRACGAEHRARAHVLLAGQAPARELDRRRRGQSRRQAAVLGGLRRLAVRRLPLSAFRREPHAHARPGRGRRRARGPGRAVRAAAAGARDTDPRRGVLRGLVRAPGRDLHRGEAARRARPRACPHGGGRVRRARRARPPDRGPARRARPARRHPRLGRGGLPQPLPRAEEPSRRDGVDRRAVRGPRPHDARRVRGVRKALPAQGRRGRRVRWVRRHDSPAPSPRPGVRELARPRRHDAPLRAAVQADRAPALALEQQAAGLVQARLRGRLVRGLGGHGPRRGERAPVCRRAAGSGRRAALPGHPCAGAPRRQLAGTS